MVWYRLKHDLTRDGWLTTRQCENVSVTQWTNSQLAAVVERRYVPDDSTRRQLHDLLATYWLGASGVEQQSRQNQCGNNSNSRSSKPVVYDADQPLMFECERAPGKPRYLQWIAFYCALQCLAPYMLCRSKFYYPFCSRKPRTRLSDQVLSTKSSDFSH